MDNEPDHGSVIPRVSSPALVIVSNSATLAHIVGLPVAHTLPSSFEESDSDKENDDASSSDEGLEPPTPRAPPAHIAALLRSSAAQVLPV